MSLNLRADIQIPYICTGQHPNDFPILPRTTEAIPLNMETKLNDYFHNLKQKEPSRAVYIQNKTPHIIYDFCKLEEIFLGSSIQCVRVFMYSWVEKQSLLLNYTGHNVRAFSYQHMDDNM